MLYYLHERKYARKLSSQFIEDLNESVLKPLLDIVKSDDELQLEIRNNYIIIYFLGGQLFKISSLAKTA